MGALEILFIIIIIIIIIIMKGKTIGGQAEGIKLGSHTHTHTHTHKQKANWFTEDELHRRILAVPGRCIGDQHRDVSKAKIFWGSSRHHGCETEAVPAAPSVPPPPGSWSVFPNELERVFLAQWSSLFSAGKVCMQAHVSGKATIDNGHWTRA